MDIQQYIERIFSIQSKNEFEALSLEAFHYQVENCEIYGDFVRHLNKPEPKTVSDIPFLPISFFKTHKVIDFNHDAAIIFKSSGTTGMERSKHFVVDEHIYQKSFSLGFNYFFGDLENCVIAALLPNYIEQGDSSLIYMIDHLIQQTKNENSGFFLDDFSSLQSAYLNANANGKKFILFGVSYALLDLAEAGMTFPEAVIFETGGMKGRREEWTKEQLHSFLCAHFQTTTIASEYGMTELLSQAYSVEDGKFKTPPWMKALIRDVNDPFSYVSEGKTGGINIIDLANIYSCSFISTQDLGRHSGDTFQLMGRFDQADLRGCNMLVQ